MKKILMLIICSIISSCSVNTSPAVTGLNGTWKINIGNEYSTDTNHINIEITNTEVIYDSIKLNNVIIEENRLIAQKNYTKDSAFKIDLTLTSETQYMWGYEYRINKLQTDSVYIFGERVK